MVDWQSESDLDSIHNSCDVWYDHQRWHDFIETFSEISSLKSWNLYFLIEISFWLDFWILGPKRGDTIVRFWKRSRSEQTGPRLECRTKVSSTSISCQTLSQGLSKSLCAHPSATIGGAICSDNTLGGIVRATFDGKNWLLLWGFHVFDLNVITTPTIINVEEPFLLNLVTFLDVYQPVLSSPLPFV